MFRFQPLPAMSVRVGPGSNGIETGRVRLGIYQCGVNIAARSDANYKAAETFAKRIADLDVERVSIVG